MHWAAVRQYTHIKQIWHTISLPTPRTVSCTSKAIALLRRNALTFSGILCTLAPTPNTSTSAGQVSIYVYEESFQEHCEKFNIGIYQSEDGPL